MGKQPFDGLFLSGLPRLLLERIQPFLDVVRRSRRAVERQAHDGCGSGADRWIEVRRG